MDKRLLLALALFGGCIWVQHDAGMPLMAPHPFDFSDRPLSRGGK
ncbi:MAG: hypothetical protein ABW217_03930 [Polyangiaceae bacterium]